MSTAGRGISVSAAGGEDSAILSARFLLLTTLYLTVMQLNNEMGDAIYTVRFQLHICACVNLYSCSFLRTKRGEVYKYATYDYSIATTMQKLCIW